LKAKTNTERRRPRRPQRATPATSVQHAIGHDRHVDAQESFLPLLLLMGLWGGSRAAKGRFGVDKGASPGGNGVFGSIFGGGAPWGSGQTGAGKGLFGGSGMNAKTFGGWPIEDTQGGALGIPGLGAGGVGQGWPSGMGWPNGMGRPSGSYGAGVSQNPNASRWPFMF
jgi:hypothetical protein